MKYKFLKHTADVKYKSYGKTLNECFENSAVAMFKSMYPKKIKGELKKEIKVGGKNLESLMYSFLEELIILLDSEDFFLSDIKVKIDEKNLTLKAIVSGDYAKNYDISLQVKAVTYNEMSIRKINGNWVCQVVLDV